MVTFFLKLIIAVTPLCLLIGSVVLLSSHRPSRSRKMVLKRGNGRTMQRALAVGVHPR